MITPSKVLFWLCLVIIVAAGVDSLIYNPAANDSVAQFNDSGQKVAFVGRVVDAPAIGTTSQKIKLNVADTSSVVLVSVPSYPEYHYLDTLKVTGKLKTPQETEDFSYKNYLMKDGIYSVMDFPAVQLISTGSPRNPVEFVYEKLLWFKHALQTSIRSYFSLPQSSIVEGVLLGGTATMPKETKAQFSSAGLTHLTAISGSNVVILSAVLMAFLLFLGFWRQQAFYVTVIFIWLYIAIAAFPASGIRAGIMATILLLAQQLGRQNTSSRVIVLAAAMMLCQNPFLLLYDVGFQLSFLASLGIIYAKPIIDYWFSFAKYEQLKKGLDILAVTLAAQVFTLPVIAYDFKMVSVVAPVTNLLVIPIIDWLMIFGFLAAFLGLFLAPLGFLLSIPSSILLGYFLKVLDLFSLPWAAATVPQFHWAWIGLYYVALALVIWLVNKKLMTKANFFL